MKIEVNVGKRYFFSILAVIIIVTSVLASYAFQQSGTGGNPAYFGHDASEISPGTFTNFTNNDEWEFPGNLQVDGLGNGLNNQMVIVDKDGNLVATGFPGPDTDFAVTDEFLGNPSLGWTGAGSSISSAYNHPGIYTISGSNNPFYLAEAITSNQIFDISFLIRPSSAAVSGAGEFTVGLFDSTTSDGSKSTSNNKIVFERKETGYTSSPTWLAVTSVTTSSKTIVDTNVPLTSKLSWVKMRIVRTDLNTINFYINDQLVATSTTNMPSPSTSFDIGIMTNINYDIDSFRMIIHDMNTRSLNCDTNAYCDTMNGNCGGINSNGGVGSTPGFISIPVPSACIGGAGCAINQIVYNSKGVYSNRTYDYRQDPSTNKWTTSYHVGSIYTNGDKTSTTIVPDVSSIYLRDDYTGTENLAGNWTIRDSTTSYGEKIYICTYS